VGREKALAIKVGEYALVRRQGGNAKGGHFTFAQFRGWRLAKQDADGLSAHPPQMEFRVDGKGTLRHYPPNGCPLGRLTDFVRAAAVLHV
jgi:hypothetical protein